MEIPCSGLSILNFQTKWESSKKTKVVEMTLVHPKAAGIDIGDSIHGVPVPVGKDVESVWICVAFTCDLEAIIECLTKCRIETVALESTRVYCKNLFIMLVQNGFEVYLVNARHTLM
jgi:transposase